MQVRDLMSTNVTTIEDTASCHQAVEAMVRQKIRHLPVVGHDGTLRGILTDRDVRHHLFARDVFRELEANGLERVLKSSPVSRLMSTPVIVARPDEPLETAARLMLEDKVGSLPVVEEGHVVGIITETDLLRRIVGGDPCCREVEEIVVSFP